MDRQIDSKIQKNNYIKKSNLDLSILNFKIKYK